MAEPRTVRADANALNSEEIAALLPHRYPLDVYKRQDRKNARRCKDRETF